MAQGRSLARQLVQNFINSFKSKNILAELKGRDHFGTEYYEAPKIQGRPSRWFSPINGDFEQEIPVEWQSWLNYKRNLPPTNEEIQMNLQKMQMAIENAKKLEPKTATQESTKMNIEKPTFPVHKDYEATPSQSGMRDEK